MRPTSSLDVVYGFVLSCLVVLTSATAVRVFDVRLSDISFGLLILLMLVALFSIRTNRVPRVVVFLFGYLVVFSVIRFAFAQFHDGIFDFSNYILVPSALGASVLFLATTTRYARIVFLKNYSVLLLLLTLGLFCAEQVLGRPGWIEIIDDTDRFSALSLNPNQLALFLLPVPFFSIALWKLENKTLSVVCVELLAVFCANVFVFGKSLFMAWVVGAVIVLVLGISPREKLRLKKKHVLLSVFLLPILILIVMPIALRFYLGDAPGSVEGQGEGRLVLWIHGLSAWLDAPLFGHGPGHYSGLDAPYEGMESHNLIVDWLSAYGLIGFLALLAFFYQAFKIVFNKSVWVCFALFSVLVLQSFFHFYARQPIFWLWWVLGVCVAIEIRAKSE
jgi:O-antigen ligase